MPNFDYAPLCSKIRETILRLSHAARSAHVGSSLSAVESLAVAFQLKRGPGLFFDNTTILSKGHAAMALYATAYAFGELPADLVETYLKDESPLWGHPSVTPGAKFIEWSTGSLGHGLPVAAGIAYARKKIKTDPRQVIVILSDGELDEGTNWEAFLFGAHHALNNLTVIIDYNKIQSFGRCDEIMSLEPLADKLNSFGWRTVEVDGHNASELQQAILKFDARPTAIIAHTVKGKGVVEYENTVESHYRPVNDQILNQYTSKAGGTNA